MHNRLYTFVTSLLLFCLPLFVPGYAGAQTKIINTIAGKQSGGLSGDGIAATTAQIDYPSGVVEDAAGNVYVADLNRNTVRMINPAGIISTIVTGLDHPSGMAIDASGNLYITDPGHGLVRKWKAGVLSIAAGGGSGGDGGPAVGAALGYPTSVGLDRAGNLYICDYVAGKIKKVTASTGKISTIAGDGTKGYAGDGGPATAAKFYWPYGLAVDTAGDVYVADELNQVIRKIKSSTGYIYRIAGQATPGGYGLGGYSGDGGPATASLLMYPYSVKADRAGNVYIGDRSNNRIRKINAAGIISTYAGNGRAGYKGYGAGIPGGYYGDGGTVDSSELYDPIEMGLDANDNLFIADAANHVVRKVTPANDIWFKGGTVQYFYPCENMSTSFNSFVAVMDTTPGETVTWTITSMPQNGLATGSYTSTSTGGLLTPSGFSYTPNPYYVGRDTFVVKATNGSLSAYTTICVTVKDRPSIYIYAPFTSICNGGSTYIKVLGDGAPGGGTTILSQDFNTSLGSWSVDNSGSVSTVYPDAWMRAADGYVDFFGPYHSPDSSGIAVVSSIRSGSGSVTKSKLISPSFSTLGYADAALYFDHSYYDNVDTCANVEVSTDGGTTWTTLIDYRTISGGIFIGRHYAFKPETLSLAPYVGQPNVKLRFYYNSPHGYQWSLDNVKVVGYATGVNASLWSPTSHLFTDNGLTNAYTTGTYDDTVYMHPTTITTTTNVKYYVTQSIAGCSTTDSITITVTPSTPITGSSAVCVGGTITLSSATPYGAWTAKNGNVYVNYSTGLVMGMTPGIDTVTYVTTGSCAATNTFTVVVNSVPPVAGAIAGPSLVCAGSAITLTNTVAGGTWRSAATSVATVSSTGVVTGVATGTVVISYTLTNGCGATAATTTITVSPAPAVALITGPASMCAGTTVTLSNPTPGGVWSSGTTTIATVSSTGVVTGVAGGTGIIFYTITNSCGSTFAVHGVTVNPLPVAGTITGVASVCPGGTTSLSNSMSGGTWSSSATGVATISSTGVVNGVATGTSVITYSVSNGCGTSVVTTTVTAQPLPAAGTITGVTTVCASASVALTNAATGGVWSSSATGVATVNALGAVTGIGAGTATISYTVTNSCGTAVAVRTVTVNPLPVAGSITGTTALCVGGTASLSNAAVGGVWSSSATSVATVAPAGLVSALAAGITIISYTVTNTCGIATATTTVSVGALPVAGTITGASLVCAGSTISLSNPATGGIWASGNTGVATISGGGVVAGVSAGMSVITYTVTNSCGTATAMATVTVSSLPVAGTITGAATLCAGATAALTDAATGGVWSSGASAIATVGGTGLVAGVSAGIAIISYSVVNSCGTATATLTITVSPLPSAGSISGTTTICTGSSGSLSSTATGGIWSSDATGVATIAGSGILAGVSVGTAAISYTVTNSCGTAAATAIVTVNPLPVSGVISGTTVLCAGATSSLSNSAPGGVWSSAATGVATVSTLGLVSGISAGTSVISYTVTNSCGTAYAASTVTVNPLPDAGIISGASAVCVGASISLTDAAPGGVWSSSLTTIATVTGAGVVSGLAVGTSVISYEVINSCGTALATKTITVNPLPDAGAITGPATVCVGSSAVLSSSVTGGIWSSGATGIATISGTGLLAGVSAGIAVVSYTVTGSCGTAVATATITVNPLPDAGAITGAAAVCVGSVAVFSNAATGGVWSSSATGVATVSSSGSVAGISAGTAVISYSVTNLCGVAIAVNTVTIAPLPASGVITGKDSVCAGETVVLSSSPAGGVWTSGNSSLATVSSAGLVSGITAGSVVISYTLSNSCGHTVATLPLQVNSGAQCSTSTTVAVTPFGLNVFPNPNNGIFKVEVFAPESKVISLVITDLLGQAVKIVAMQTNTQTDVQLDVASGVYILAVEGSSINETAKIVVMK